MPVDIKKHSKELRDVLGNIDEFHEQVDQIANKLRETFEDGHTVYVAGNGGSAAEAQHLSDEMLGRYKNDRRAYPVVALTADTAAITCIANDYGYEYVFSRQLEALGREGDVFIGLSTSGESKNIIKAAQVARARGMTVIVLTGPVGDLRDMADLALIAPTETGSRMQEMHLHGIHLICEYFEES